MQASSNDDDFDRQVRHAWDDLLGGQGDGVAAMAPGQSKTEAFCKNWPMVKAILEMLAKGAPEALKIVIVLMIVFGDTLHQRICTSIA